MKGIKIFLLFSIFCFLTGCSGLKEATKGFLGVSTKSLDNARSDSLRNDFAGSLSDIHNKIKDALMANHSYIYKDAKSSDFIALYVSETDTTPVGIFLTKVGEKRITVEVSSPSTYGKELIAKVIYDALAEPKITGKEKGSTDDGK